MKTQKAEKRLQDQAVYSESFDCSKKKQPIAESFFTNMAVKVNLLLPEQRAAVCPGCTKQGVHYKFEIGRPGAWPGFLCFLLCQGCCGLLRERLRSKMRLKQKFGDATR